MTLDRSRCEAMNLSRLFADLCQRGGRISLRKVNHRLAIGKGRLQIIAEVNLRRYLKLRIDGCTCDDGLTHPTPSTVDKELQRSHRKSEPERMLEAAALGRRAVIQFPRP